MNLRLVVYLAGLVVLATTHDVGHAQQARHDVHVRLPDVAGIRIVGAGSGARRVDFDLVAAGDGYVNGVASGVVAPTGVHRFEDLQVNVNRQGRWSVHVVATPFVDVATGASTDLDVGRVEVRRGVSSGLVQDAIAGSGASAGILDAWQLSTASQRIAFRSSSTGGWRSLGFSGHDYRLLLDGTEPAGDHATVVVYTLTSP